MHHQGVHDEISTVGVPGRVFALDTRNIWCCDTFLVVSTKTVSEAFSGFACFIIACGSSKKTELGRASRSLSYANQVACESEDIKGISR